MSLPDPLKSTPDLTSRPGDRPTDHEVDLLLNEIDERLASHGAPAETNMAGLDMLAEPLDPADDPAPTSPSRPAFEDSVHQAALGEALAAVAPAGVAAAAAAAADNPESISDEAAALPLIGKQPPAQQQRVLIGMIAGGALAFVLTGGLALNAASKQAGQLAATGQALM